MAATAQCLSSYRQSQITVLASGGRHAFGRTSSGRSSSRDAVRVPAVSKVSRIIRLALRNTAFDTPIPVRLSKSCDVESSRPIGYEPTTASAKRMFRLCFQTGQYMSGRPPDRPSSPTSFPSPMGCPSVTVPVLSNRILSILPCGLQAFSVFDEDAVFGSPCRCPTMMAVGVASPSAQGQAMMRTVTNANRPCVKPSDGASAHPQGERKRGRCR